MKVIFSPSRFLLLFFLIFCSMPITVYASFGGDLEESRLNVVMRTIGHELLLNVGDSTSRVLPVEKIGDDYKITFENEFGFEPSVLVSIVDSVVSAFELEMDYVVEVIECRKQEGVYAYAKEPVSNPNMAVCAGRDLPKACYEIVVKTFGTSKFANDLSEEKTNSLGSIMLIIPMLLLLIFAGYLVSKKSPDKEDPDIFKIGSYLFNTRNMTLALNETRYELSNKESELLALLYTHANKPLEREVILKKVWGDDGDYIGRTLDVFVSKLRKKLDGDENVKIVNIRGVGYKLVSEL